MEFRRCAPRHSGPTAVRERQSATGGPEIVVIVWVRGRGRPHDCRRGRQRYAGCRRCMAEGEGFELSMAPERKQVIANQARSKIENATNVVIWYVIGTREFHLTLAIPISRLDVLLGRCWDTGRLRCSVLTVLVRDGERVRSRFTYHGSSRAGERRAPLCACQLPHSERPRPPTALPLRFGPSAPGTGHGKQSRAQSTRADAKASQRAFCASTPS